MTFGFGISMWQDKNRQKFRGIGWGRRSRTVTIMLMVVLGLLLCRPGSATAALACDVIDQHRVCLEAVKRSAKYGWEYRAVVSVDGQRQPEQRHDCRMSPQRPKSGTAEADNFSDLSHELSKADALAEAQVHRFICQLVHF